MSSSITKTADNSKEKKNPKGKKKKYLRVAQRILKIDFKNGSK